MTISIFSWNGKFLVKFEQGPCEQTYKFEHLDLTEDQLRQHISIDFCTTVLRLFKDMHALRAAGSGNRSD